jgi:hypothetical protein
VDIENAVVKVKSEHLRALAKIWGDRTEGPAGKYFAEVIRLLDRTEIELSGLEDSSPGDTTNRLQRIGSRLRGALQYTLTLPFRLLFIPWTLIPYQLERWRRTERAWLYFHAADELFLSLAPDSVIISRLPEIYARAKHVFAPDDPRLSAVADLYRLHTAAPNHLRSAVSTTTDSTGEVERDAETEDTAATYTLGTERRTLSSVLHAVYGASDRGYVQAWTFRNVILTGTTLLSLATGGLLAAGAVSPNLLPLCVKVSGDQMVCPAGGGSPSGGDILIVALFGALGAGISAISAISTLRHIVDPYLTPIHQGLLKVPIGALASVLGVMGVGSGVVTGIPVIDGQGAILFLAFLFGYSQQLLTRIVDERGSRVRQGLSGERQLTDPETGSRSQ